MKDTLMKVKSLEFKFHAADRQQYPADVEHLLERRILINYNPEK